MVETPDRSLSLILAELGVGLFAPAASVRTPSTAELEDLITRLITAGDPRLFSSLPCLFVLHDQVAPEAVRRVAEQVAGVERASLGLAWRLARAFAIQWEPDVVHLFGSPHRLPALAVEPQQLPDPEDDFGERCPAIARELHAERPEGNVVIDLIDSFHTWLRQTELERPAIAHA